MGGKRIQIANAESDIAQDGLVMALLAAVQDQKAAMERVVLLSGELAKRREIALLVE